MIKMSGSVLINNYACPYLPTEQNRSSPGPVQGPGPETVLVLVRALLVEKHPAVAYNIAYKIYKIQPLPAVARFRVRVVAQNKLSEFNRN